MSFAVTGWSTYHQFITTVVTSWLDGKHVRFSKFTGSNVFVTINFRLSSVQFLREWISLNSSVWRLSICERQSTNQLKSSQRTSPKAVAIAPRRMLLLLTVARFVMEFYYFFPYWLTMFPLCQPIIAPRWAYLRWGRKRGASSRWALNQPSILI